MTDYDEIPPSPPNPNKGESKTSRIPIKVVPLDKPLPKPKWIRGRAPSGPEVARLKALLREHKLNTVCEEAACPNLGECFRHGTATFMIMGKNCTRRCPFCDVGHGRPDPLDENEPMQLAKTIQDIALKFVVITSVDRDDLRDGGAQHFVDCITAVRAQSPGTSIEILVPDFRGRLDKALDIFENGLPDILNHNLETVSRLYKQARPGADYQHSLSLVKQFGERFPDVPTKSGLMVGLGETNDEIEQVMQDLRDNDCKLLTIGQYLQPGPHHLPVLRYVTPEEFLRFEKTGLAMGFNNVASGPMVRSSYHAELQAHNSI